MVFQRLDVWLLEICNYFSLFWRTGLSQHESPFNKQRAVLYKMQKLESSLNFSYPGMKNDSICKICLIVMLCLLYNLFLMIKLLR